MNSKVSDQGNEVKDAGVAGVGFPFLIFPVVTRGHACTVLAYLWTVKTGAVEGLGVRVLNEPSRCPR